MKGNALYPIFLKLNQLHVLVVGGGNVALEKVSFLFKSSPDAHVTLVAPEVKSEILELAKVYDLKILRKVFNIEDLRNKNIVLVATGIQEVNLTIYEESKKAGILVNVADTPELCDFYLGGIVTKGDLKIAISTNGKSPTFAKQLRKMLEELLPENIDLVLNSLYRLRRHLEGDFRHKVDALEKITNPISEVNE